MSDYPHQTDLDRIVKWTGKDGTPLDLMHFVESVMNPDYGILEFKETTNTWDEPITEVRYVTGGWSGNEDIIGALMKNLFWAYFWESTHRGGLYFFHISK